ncbi:MAG: SMP-30/gluconolactonase/LRE family protein, partial [Chloroflexi bacterium]|nr:SMP-30/gluconolactonase/LRE family protein [Chloroflexota bacterium]
MSWRFSLLNRFEDPPGGITEGPAWNGEVALFTHIHASRIYAYNPKSGEFSVFRENTNRTNGLAFDADGRLFGCCQNGRAIVRFDPDGSMVTVADNLDGVPLNTPNDLAIDRQGRIWFTNPWNAGNIDPHEVEQLDHRSVLCAVPQADGSYQTVRSTWDTTMPN